MMTYEQAMKFKFRAMTAQEAEDLTGAPAEEFTEPGIYRVLQGSRGLIEEVVRQDGELEILTLDQAIQAMLSDDMDAEEIQGTKEYVEEYYYLDVDAQFNGALNFSYTEEDCDIFVKVT